MDMAVVGKQEVDWNEVGARIRSLRRDKGLTQRELGEPVASPSFLSLIESGTRQPSREVLSHIADRLGVEPEELVMGRSPRADVELELRLQDAREHLRLGELDEAVEGAREVVSDARELGSPRVEAKCYELLASIEERRELHESALELYRKAEHLWAAEPPHLRFQTVAGIALCLQAQGDPRLGIHMLESYLLELERQGLPDPIATMRTYSSLVICYSRMGLATKAAEAAEKAQALAPRVSDAEQLACMNLNVTHSLFAQGRMDDALNAIRQAETAYMALGWEIDAARAKVNQGVVQIERGDLEQARRNLTEAAEALKAGNHPADAAKAIDELGRLERLSGDDSAAERLLREAQGLLGQGDFAERGLNLRELGLCLEVRDRNEAKGYLRRAIDLFLLAGANTEVAATYKLLGDLHRKAGEIEQCADAYRAGIEAVEASIS
ncbi:MAG: helix-turn-helix domain-containing protein [Actinomycetota bacterium]